VTLVRGFKKTRVVPVITKYSVEDAPPFELLPAFKGLNIAGVDLKGHGCRGGSGLLAGLIAMETARVDKSIAALFDVHRGMAISSISLGGSEEQPGWFTQRAKEEMNGS